MGIELDAPTGKNDGTVQGISYFSCRPKHGIFVRADKLIQDKRGRGMRLFKSETAKTRRNYYYYHIMMAYVYATSDN